MQRSLAEPTTAKPGCGGELLIDAVKETNKCGILQKDVAHFVGLLAW